MKVQLHSFSAILSVGGGGDKNDLLREIRRVLAVQTDVIV